MIDNNERVPDPSHHILPMSRDDSYAYRDVLYSELSDQIINDHGLIFDSDVFKGTTPLTLNRHLYIINSCFKSADQINDFLNYWGKKPSFIVIKLTESKGYGAFATAPIRKGTFIGFYQGLLRPPYNNEANKYIYTVRSEMTVDAENMLFADWTRYLNHSDTPNVGTIVHHQQVLLVTGVTIQDGDELCFNYGYSYNL
jgi:SET domain-containing protein